MTTSFTEITGRTHRSGQSPTARLIYRVESDTADTDLVIDDLEDSTTGIPSTFDGLTRKTIELEEIDGAGKFLAVVTYSSSAISRTAVGTEVISYSTSEQMVRTYVSKETTASYGSSTPDYDQAVNVVTENGQNRAEGVDIPVATLMMTVEKTYSSEPSQTFISTLYDLLEKTNDATFKGWAVGEVRFAGFATDKVSDSEWKITFRFAISKNVTATTFGSIAVTLGKKGWEYIWGRFESIHDSVNKAVVPNATAAYVERMYDSGDFSTTGLSVT